MLGRQDRSRSPVKVDKVGRRREMKSQSQDVSKSQDMSNVLNMNQMMMANMYQQGNMMLNGMYNMMMPSTVMGATLMPSASMDSYQSLSGSGIEMITQPQMEISDIASTQMASTGSGTMDLSMMGGMIMDPNMMGIYSNMGQEAIQEKKEILLKHCKLTPPPLGTPSPPRRMRPPGCRTVFIGGLPEKIRESTVRDIFERYGRIQILRLSKKNFCHIRFDREACVDAAMSITGYHIKLTSKDKKEDEDDDTRARNGWLHVDYALSRDDQNEYERRQRQALRLQEQQMQQLSAQQEALATTTGTAHNANIHRSPSPVRIQSYSSLVVGQVADRIKSAEHFSSTLPTLIAWLERGDCSKKNSNQFYSMIQSTNSHIRRLCNEKVQAEDELLECKERVKTNIQSIIEQLEQVAKVFVAATHQRVWDHFTKSQRKNIETWQKMTQEFNAMKEEFYEKFFSEDGEFNSYKSNTMDDGSDELQELKLENESLRFQLEAYKNEVDVIKTDAQKEMEKFKAQFIARQALQGAMEKNPPLPSPIVKPPPPPPPPLPDDLDNKVIMKEDIEAGCGEAKLIGVMSAFLQVHPQGASLDYVVSYVRALFPGATQATVHRVLQKHRDVFQQNTTGVGADIGTRWTFVAYTTNNYHQKKDE